jgi:NAD(P)-dependent dehydrogenase (short-subunit alcohol dehydrogenase family)
MPTTVKMDSLTGWNDYAGSTSDGLQGNCRRYGACSTSWTTSVATNAFHPRAGTSKCMNILWVSHLQKQLEEQGIPITALVLHPGTIATSPYSLSQYLRLCADGSTDALTQSLGYFIGLLCKVFGVTPAEGAYTTLFACCSATVADKRNEYKGKYLEPVGQITQPKTKVACDEELAQILWDATRNISSEILS